MKLHWSIAAIAVLLAGVSALRSQAVPARVWEYAYIYVAGEYTENIGPSSETFTDIVVCRATAKSCESQSRKVPGNHNDAMMKTAAGLGDEGWEMFSVIEPNNGKFRMVYLRRQRDAAR